MHDIFKILFVEAIPFSAAYLFFTLVNYIRLIPEGILVQTLGFDGGFSGSPFDQFYSAQIYVLFAAVAIGISVSIIYFLINKEK